MNTSLKGQVCNSNWKLSIVNFGGKLLRIKRGQFLLDQAERDATHINDSIFSSGFYFIPLVILFYYFISIFKVIFISFFHNFVHILLAATCYTLSICTSVPCLCHILNVFTPLCANVLFNWRCPSTAMASLQQQACSVSLCTL